MPRGVQQLVVALTDGDVVPLRFRAVVVDIGQIGAKAEDSRADGGDAVAEGHRRQAVTALKRVRTDGGDPVAEGNGSQTGVAERPLTDHLYVIAHFHAVQPTVETKGVSADLFQTLAEDDLF